MTTQEAMKTLGISSRNTLSSYVRKKYIKAIKKPNGRYIYDDESIYNFLEGKKVEDNE